MVHLRHTSIVNDAVTDLELPVRLLKRVLVGHGIRLGGRVLVAGCGHGELIAFLDGIAYNVDAIDDSPKEIDEARRRFPQFEFRLARLDESIPAPNDEFDLILVRDLCVYRDNLLDLRTRSATANLLACLKPGGDLVFIQKHARVPGCGSGHDTSCWKRHLACFPGQVETKEYPETLMERAVWDWLCGVREHTSHFTVGIQTPLEKLNPTFWRDFAHCGLLTGQSVCCPGHAKPKNDLPRAA